MENENTLVQDHPKNTEYAGFWWRFLAAIIDNIVISFVAGIFIFIIYPFVYVHVHEHEHVHDKHKQICEHGHVMHRELLGVTQGLAPWARIFTFPILRLTGHGRLHISVCIR